MTQQQVADKVGKSRTAITNALRLLKLEGPIKIHLTEGTLSTGHAKILLSAPEGEKTSKPGGKNPQTQLERPRARN